MSTPGSARAQVPPLTRGERTLLGFAAVLGVGVGGVGLALSFDTVSVAGARWGFATPQMLPVGIDLAIPVFTVVNLLLIRLDMPLAWVRFVPWALTLVTCWLNVAAGHSLSAKVAHGTMPMLWVVLSEVAAHTYAVRIGAVTGRRMETIRRSRWVLAPVTTFALWRRMTLWEITSYTDALARERARQLARAELRQAHGLRWRSRTDRRTRVLLRLGELAPATPDPAPVPAAETAVPAEAGSAPAAAPRRRGGKPAAKSARPARRAFPELLGDARELTAGWADGELTAERLRSALHCGQAQARQVRDALKADRSTADPGPEPHRLPGDDPAPAVEASAVAEGVAA